MGVFFNESHDGGVDGESLTASNSAYASFVGPPVFDDAQSYATGKSMLCVAPNKARLVYTATGSTRYFRLYFRLSSATPAAAASIIRFWNDTFLRGELLVGTNGKLNLRNNTPAIFATSTTTLAANTWYRVEIAFTSATMLECRLFAGADIANAVESPTETLSGDPGTGAQADRLNLGNDAGGPINVWFDEVAASDTTWIGPVATVNQGTLSGSAPSPSSSLAATASTAGSIIGSTPSPTCALTASARLLGTVGGNTLSPTGSLAATATAVGSMAGTAPTPAASLTATASTAGALSGSAPSPTSSLAVTATATGSLSGDAPSPTSSLSGGAGVVGGNLTASPESPVADLSGVATAFSTVIGGPSAAEGSFEATASVSGLVDATAPAVEAALEATLSASGALSGSLLLPTSTLHGTVMRTVRGIRSQVTGGPAVAVIINGVRRPIKTILIGPEVSRLLTGVTDARLTAGPGRAVKVAVGPEHSRDAEGPGDTRTLTGPED